MKISKKYILSFSVGRGIDLVHLIVSFILIFIAAYFFGSSLIIDPLSGNDSLNNLTYIAYLDKYFPHIPFWFPYQGGGQSITLGYPQLYSFTVIILNRLTGLTLVSSMAVMNFLALLLPAWGVYLFILLRLKSRTGALIGGLLFLLSPLVYVWIWGAGFLAQVSSVVFVCPFLIFLDWYIDHSLEKKTKLFALVGASLFGVLAFLSHPVTLMGLLAFTMLYSFGRIIFDKSGKLKDRALNLIPRIILLLVVLLGLCAFWYFPLDSYSKYSNRGLVVTDDTTLFAPIEFKGVLGLQDRQSGYPFGDFSIYTPVWILAVISIILGYFYNRKVSVIGILAILGIYFTGSLTIWKFFVHISNTIGILFTLRPWYPLVAVLNPIAGAMGAIFLARLILTPFYLKVVDRMFRPLAYFIKSIRYLILPIISFVVVFIFVFLLRGLSGHNMTDRPYFLPIGANIDGINTKAIWNRTLDERCLLPKTHKKWSQLCEEEPFLGKYFEINTLFSICDSYPKDMDKPVVCLKDNVTQEEKLAYIDQCLNKPNIGIFLEPYYSPCLALGKDMLSQLKRWPVPKLKYGKDDFSELELFEMPQSKREIISGENHRIDVTPHFGSAVKSWFLTNKSSILNAYTGQLSLIKRYYSIFNDSFYDSPQTPPDLLNSLAYYFGTEAVIVNASKSPMNSFKEANWDREGGEFAFVFPPFNTGLVTVSNTPRILVLGSENKGVYNQIFSVVNIGALPFEDGIIVNGGDKVDLNLDYLSTFDGVILQGYQYKNRGKDLETLTEYVKNGGSLYIDTGWQYVSDDWGRQEQGGTYSTSLTEPFPVTKTTWGSVGNNWKGAKVDKDFDSGITISKFAPLVWGDGDWNVASAGEVTPWAKPILSKEGALLIAGGELGKGKVVWSGMNIIPHSMDNKNSGEVKLLNNIFSYLFKKGEPRYSNFSLNRPDPDHLTVTINENLDSGYSLYFREGKYTAWKAYLLQGDKRTKLDIIEAGPGFMMVVLPQVSKGDSIFFEFSNPPGLVKGILITLIVIVLLLVLIIDKLITKGKISQFIKSRFAFISDIIFKPFRRGFSSLKKDFNKEDDDY